MPHGRKVSDLAKNEDNLFWTAKEDVNAPDKAREKMAPSFTIMLQNAQASESSPARFACAVSGFPRPKINWFHNGALAVQVSGRFGGC